jgi:hypothetical protein
MDIDEPSAVMMTRRRESPTAPQSIEIPTARLLGLHMTDIIGSVHLNQESIRIIELERFL